MSHYLLPILSLKFLIRSLFHIGKDILKSTWNQTTMQGWFMRQYCTRMRKRTKYYYLCWSDDSIEIYFNYVEMNEKIGKYLWKKMSYSY